jgi:hypothetical protein
MDCVIVGTGGERRPSGPSNPDPGSPSPAPDFQCGESASTGQKIIAGDDVDIEDYPWQTYLIMSKFVGVAVKILWIF